MRSHVYPLAAMFIWLAGPAAAQAAPHEGFYKDLFIDCGVHLLCAEPHAANALELSHESMRVRSKADQTSVLVSNKNDDNGVLLYPDGAPRYRAIYVNGGESKDHGRTLGAQGLARVRSFFERGGSYTGSCAGAFISSAHRMGEEMRDTYFAIWPGETTETWFDDRKSSWYIGPTGFHIEQDSPLLDYYDFGDDLYVDAIKHYEGPYANETSHWPKGTQVLARFDLPEARFHNTPSVWAYSPDPGSGRLVVVASHPENYASGERRDLMAAIFSYALDGTGQVRLKGHLKANRTLEMNKGTEDQDPCRTKIGDGQIHHFIWNVPKGSTSIDIELSGDATLSSGEPANLDLFASPGAPAWPSDATHRATGDNAKESLHIEDPEPGLWYISVRGTTLAIPASENDATRYKGNLGALNGVGYSLGVRVDNQAMLSERNADQDPYCDKFLDEIQELPEDDSGASDDSTDQTPTPSSPNPSDAGQSSDTPAPSSDGGASNPSSTAQETGSATPPGANPEDKDPGKGCRVHAGQRSGFAAFGFVLVVLPWRSRRRCVNG